MKNYININIAWKENVKIRNIVVQEGFYQISLII